MYICEQLCTNIWFKPQLLAHCVELERKGQLKRAQKTTKTRAAMKTNGVGKHATQTGAVYNVYRVYHVYKRVYRNLITIAFA